MSTFWDKLWKFTTFFFLNESFPKEFNKSHDFCYGLFSVGCYCALNVTVGFELMLEAESSRNLFRLLTCRDVDLTKLKGL